LASKGNRHPLARSLRFILFGGLLGCALSLLWACWLEPRRLVVTRAELELAGWPKPLSGLRVALLSDLHVGSPFWDLPALSRLVERTNAEKPDLVLLAGDYQINDVPGGAFVAAEPIAERLGALRAPLGVLAVLGNHDWWNDGEEMRRALTAHGIVVLEESARRIEQGGSTFYVVGLADQITRLSAPQEALALVPAQAPTLLLVHEPDVFESFPRLGVWPTLTLAGHTHGGQVCLPLLGRRIVPSRFGERYAYGHIVENGRQLFVTSGVGTSVFPIRFGVPPEIALLTLRSAHSPGLGRAQK
jgi:predicted MPP superfamily phosphohydrolase